jgi:GH24 family phage-related lysozyme (muramidase)
MAISLLRTEEIRDILYNLNLQDGEHNEIYEYLSFEFISHNEEPGGIPALTAYDDGKGYSTIGYGFNMDSVSARIIWEEAIGCSVSFTKAKNKEVGITKEQAFDLYLSVKMRNTRELQNIYANSWEKLKPNEKLMIQDLYFNAGSKLVGRQTRFYKNILHYSSTANPMYLQEALIEVKERSNREKITNPRLARGIQNRRNVQATMGDSLSIYTR